MSYTHEEVLRETLAYFNNDTLAADVWINKYCMKDSDGNLYEKSPDDMHWRIAREMARVESMFPNPIGLDECYALLANFKYLVFGGGGMTGIGNDMQVTSLANCYVVCNEGKSDSYGGIFRVDEMIAQLQKRRGGVGTDLSHIRPKGSPVKNSALTSTGIVPFMERYSNTTREVAQDGRRGALMLSLSIRHPEAENFINAKLVDGKVTGANISVKIDDDFMNAALYGYKYTQQFPVDSDAPSVVKDIDASKLWAKIVYNAWKSAEPGILFWDTIIRESVSDCYADLGHKTISTNPCGEIPLDGGSSCILMSINLYSYVNDPFTDMATFNWSLFKEHCFKGQRFIDNLITLELEKVDRIIAKIDSDPESNPVKECERSLWVGIRGKCTNIRRSGFGITAEGDMLAALGLRYGSDEANDFSEEIHRVMKLEAYRSSVDMAKDRGSFKIYDPKREENNPFIARIREEDEGLYNDMVKYGRRNICLLTCAPTGTLSLMTQTSSGIEPCFLPYYKRRRKINPNDKSTRVDFVDSTGDAFSEYYVFHHKFVDYMKIKGYTEDKINSLSVEELDAIVAGSPYYKATSADVDWTSKVKMQGMVQKHIDHSISVTVNVPEETTVETVSSIYEAGWKYGCKGITIYRAGSRDGVLISDKTPKKTEASVIKRGKFLDADIVRFNNNKEKWIAFVGIKDGNPYEVFTGKIDEDTMNIPTSVKHGVITKVKLEDGTSRYDFTYTDKQGYKTTLDGISRIFDSVYWNYARLISGVLRHGMPVADVVDLVWSMHFDSDSISTWKFGVVKALKSYIKNGTVAGKKHKCDNCGSTNLIYQEGCLLCKDCGIPKCGS